MTHCNSHEATEHRQHASESVSWSHVLCMRVRSRYRDNVVLLADKKTTFSYQCYYSCQHDSTFRGVKIGLSTKDANARDRQQTGTWRNTILWYVSFRLSQYPSDFPSVFASTTSWQRCLAGIIKIQHEILSRYQGGTNTCRMKTAGDGWKRQIDRTGSANADTHAIPSVVN